MGKKALFILSVVSGILLGLPWQTGLFSWALFVAFIPLLSVTEQILSGNDTQKSPLVFFHAFVAFFVWNVLSTWWLSYVSFTGMLMISFLNALLMAAVWWLAFCFRQKFSAETSKFALVIFWLSFEFLHYNWAVNWPWLNLGNGFANNIQLVQWYEFTGVLGGSFWILLMNLLLFRLYKVFRAKLFKEAVLTSVLVLLLFILPAAYSGWRYNSYSETGNSVEVVVLQPNVDPFTEKFSGMSHEEQINRLVRLAENTVTTSTQFVVAPETSLPPLWENTEMKNDSLLQPIVSFMEKYPNLKFIAGALTQRLLNSGETVSYYTRRLEDGRYFQVYNSALLIDQTPEVLATHKRLLVTGVEKMPFEQYFSFLKKFFVDAGGISGSLAPADEIAVLRGDETIGIGPVICFESVFGGHAGRLVAKGASVLFVITNDGWLKSSPGIRQHFNYSRLRAIETRRWVVRSANTGISGVINARGEVVCTTEVNTITGFREQALLNDSLTFYVRNGDLIGLISILLSVLYLTTIFFDVVRRLLYSIL